MVAQPKTGNDQDDSRRRFQEARERYNKLNQGKFQTESLASDSNADEVAMATTLDFLRKMADRNQVPKVTSRGGFKGDNQNRGPGLPVPLPVVPVAPEQLIIQQNTNKLVDRLVKSTSKERTLQMVVDTLVELTASIERFTNAIIDRFGDIAGHWSSRFEKYSDDQSKSTGWVAKMVRGMLGNSDHHTMSFAEALETFTKPIIKFTKGTYELLARQTAIINAAARGDQIDEARASVKGNALSGMSEAIFPKGSVIRNAIDVVKGIGDFFAKIGQFGAEKLGQASGSGGLLGTLSSLLASGGTMKIIGLFGGVAGFITAVVGSVAFASVYSFFRNPDQLARLFGAFSTLFTEVITPALKWITTEILPPLSVAFTGLTIAFDKLLVAVGTVVNETLIYLIGTAIPETAKLIGKQIDTFWQTTKKIFWRIAGIFGFGEHAENGIFHNILMAIVEFGDGLLEMIATVPTKILQMLDLDEMIGLKDDESIYGRMKRFVFVEIPEFLVKVFNGVMDYIGQLDPLKYITDQIQGIIDWFMVDKEASSTEVISKIKSKIVEFFSSVIDLLTGWIPSWEDMKGWLRNIIPEGTPTFLKNWLEDKLSAVKDTTSSAYEAGSELAKEGYKDLRTRIDPALRDIQNRIDNLPLDPWTRNTGMNGGAPVIIAPQTTNTTNNNMSGGGGTDRIGIGSPTAPTSRLDEMIFRANPF